MTTIAPSQIVVAAVSVLLLGAVLWLLILRRKLKAARELYEQESLRIRTEAEKLTAEQLAVIKQEGEQIRKHYEDEMRHIRADTEPLRQYQGVADASAQAQNILAKAMEEAEALRKEAQAAIERARLFEEKEKAEASAKALELTSRADIILNQATRDAGKIIADANIAAERIAGDAYVALRDKQLLEQAIKAIENVIDGYGDRYVKPTRSVLDDLAAHFGYTEAGEALKRAREQSRRMVEQGAAAQCSYAEPNRRETAIRFVIDAFNGRVDAILTRTKHDNFGTLEQEIRDAAGLVNLNGRAFRDAQILPTYLEARLAELKWAVAIQELRLKEREEQRRIQEQIREEEKARREYERAMREAQRDEESLKRALEVARNEVAQATEEQRAKFDQQIKVLMEKLAEAEARNLRAKSMAEQTRAGHVYIISNIGAFGEEIFKIGMTRRLEPEDRVWELSNASVPFDFDIHAMIYSADAPDLEHRLHEEFEDLRVNKANYRKEFFRVPLDRIQQFVSANGFKVSFTMVAAAREFRETKALEKMPMAERLRYESSGQAVEDAAVESAD